MLNGIGFSDFRFFTFRFRTESESESRILHVLLLKKGAERNRNRGFCMFYFLNCRILKKLRTPTETPAETPAFREILNALTPEILNAPFHLETPEFLLERLRNSEVSAG